MGLLVLLTNGYKEADWQQHLVIKLKTLGIWVFECTSIQRQLKTKWEVDAIFVVNYNINNKNNDNTDKIIYI